MYCSYVPAAFPLFGVLSVLQGNMFLFVMSELYIRLCR